MALPTGLNDREYAKFEETAGGNTAVRVVGSSGSSQIDVNNQSVDVGGYIGKASGTNADFTTAYASATTITLSAFPTDVSAFVGDDIVTVEQYSTAGVQTARYSRDDAIFSIAGNVLTVSGATFTNTDTFVIYTNVARPSGGSSGSSAGGSGIIVGNEIGTYAFDASAQTVTITGMSTLKLEDIQQITNVTDGIVIYTPGDSAKGATISSNVLTLEYDTTGMADADALQIYVQYNNSEDYTLNITKQIEQSPLWSRYTSPAQLVNSK